MTPKSLKFWILISLVAISGFSQGMLLPLLAVILEQAGVPSSVNGLHATGLYIGVLIASPFMEKPLQKVGYKPIILIGGLLVFVSLAFFPIWEALWFWFVLRLLIGIGDHMLHFGTQTWITATSEASKRGRNIAFYGLFFSVGFSLGPVMTRLLSINQSLPFIISAILCFMVWSLMFFIRNELPSTEDELSTSNRESSIRRFIQAGKIAWVAFLAPFAYGILESTLHSSFPIYGMRIGHDVNMISLVIPCFAAASLITQIPLGMLSDRLGRKKLLSILLSIGVIIFFVSGLVEHSIFWLFITFSLAGMCIGSLFSLGISYMADLLPSSLLAAGNIMCGIAFSVGSISGPYISGLFIEYLPNISLFFIIAVILSFVLIGIVFKKETALAAS